MKITCAGIVCDTPLLRLLLVMAAICCVLSLAEPFSYDRVRRFGQKGYVRLVTSLGNLNIEVGFCVSILIHVVLIFALVSLTSVALRSGA